MFLTIKAKLLRWCEKKQDELWTFAAYVAVGLTISAIVLFLYMVFIQKSPIAIGIGVSFILFHVIFSIVNLYGDVLNRIGLGRDRHNIKYITFLYMRKKLKELYAAAFILVIVSGALYFLDSSDGIKLTVLVFAPAAFHHLLVIYRIKSGRFGYNSREMKELAEFLFSSQHHDIPPGSKKLKPYPELIQAEPRRQSAEGVSVVK